jgi:diguanylate cyclase
MVRTVLVIEDESTLRENLVSLLVHEGFAAIGAADGLEGLAQAKYLVPQLILCDVMMPLLDGHGVLQALRQDPITANIPFIFLSGQTEYQQIRQGMNLGADDYLVKPLVKAELIKAINSRLTKQQAQAAATTAPPLFAPSPLEVPHYAANATQPSLQPNTPIPQLSAAVQLGMTQLLPLASNQGITQISTPEIKAGEEEPRFLESKSWEALLPSVQKDILTGLLNRHAFLQVLQVMLERARQYDQMVALLSLNVIRFGSINTAYGYEVGDCLLQQLADRLAQCIGVHGLVGRSNGDEFLIALDELFWEEDARSWAQTIQQACSQPFYIAGKEIIIHVSLGGACCQGLRHPDQLLLQADMARRACEEAGQIPYVFHDPPSAKRAVEQRLLETELNRAILQHEFQVYYQPQLTLPHGVITGVEALLRWRHPYRGMVAPDRFIAIAEDLGLIVPIGEWVLRTACRQAKLWQAINPVPLKMSVNLSMRQLQQENLAEQVTRILQVTELHPQQLTLELTETNLMADMDAAIQTLTTIRDLGVKIAIDDFGKGYSSLHYLSHLPIDILKIDQSFVQQIPTDSHARAIINAVITMAHELNLTTIAEGVESLEQANFLQAHGCYTLQGHLYSPAMPQAELENLLWCHKSS